MSFKDDIQIELAHLFGRGAALIHAQEEPSGEAYVIIHADNIGLQIARDRDRVITINVFPAKAPELEWPIDQVLWFVNKTKEIPARLANKTLHEWARELLASQDKINAAFSFDHLPAAIDEITEIAQAQQKKFMNEFRNNPDKLFGKSTGN